MTAPLNCGYVSGVTIKLGLQIPNFSYGTGVAELFPTVIAQAQEAASRHFAGQAVPGFSPAFRALDGVPVLAHAAVALAARIEHRYNCGDHTMFVGEVEDLAVNEPAPPLLYYGGRYGTLLASPWTPEPYPSFF